MWKTLQQIEHKYDEDKNKIEQYIVLPLLK